MKYIVYKVYYGDELVYIGRTKQKLVDRMRMHFFGNPMVPKLNVFDTSKIEYALFQTECDQFVYEVYLINLYRPKLNLHDLGKDNLTIYLPEPKFYIWENKIIDKWKDKRIDYLIDTSTLDFSDEDFYFY